MMSNNSDGDIVVGLLQIGGAILFVVVPLLYGYFTSEGEVFDLDTSIEYVDDGD